MDSSQPIDPDEAHQNALYRLEMLDAFVVALDRRRELIEIAASASDADQANSQLREAFDLTEIQATAALDFQVRRFTGRERQRIIEERDAIRTRLGLA